jgi:chaperonin cofactor prefoldin
VTFLVEAYQDLQKELAACLKEKEQLKQLLAEVHSRMVRGGTQTVDVNLPCDVMDEIWEVIK